ncbi:MAG: type VI secretion system tip protein TssI/VgrG [Desulforegulaceae bacterium]|nr:type VI secretion system tip protein TssI/VgrG [Desulforegulaceae bacterium]
MADQERKFSFVSLGMPGDTFQVVRFKGSEGLSTVYSFEIELISTYHDLSLNEVIRNPARFTILRKEGNIPFNGILIEFEQLHQADKYSFYKAVLVPKLWWLSQTMHNQVFLNKSVPEILESLLKDGGLNENDFETKLQNDYPKREYVCQYKETHLNFFERWMEREGIYYFFEQTSRGEKIIITDTVLSHSYMNEGKIMYYSPPSGLDSISREEVVKNFSCRQKLLPASLRLKDYNYKKPSITMEALAQVCEEGRGEVYLYGENFETPDQGFSLAKIRAQELQCRQRTYHGESTIPFMRPGYIFELKNHYRNEFNNKYLNIQIFHEGNQSSFLLAGLSKDQLSEREKSQYYINNFTAIESDIQFRPERKTPKPKFYGTINARIDASGSGEYAELDEMGRYKVVLPFDMSGRYGGKASTWLRMMQPYAGRNQGMHFPLHKGTEVLLTFIDGDTDRPIIAGAVPNPETSSPVTSENQTKSIIKTGRNIPDSTVGAASWQTGIFNYLSDNFIEIDDKKDEEKIRIHSPKDIWIESERYADYDTGGPKTETDVPKDIKYLWKKFYSESPDFNPTGMKLYNYGSESAIASETDIESFKKLAEKGKVELSKGDTFAIQEGNIYDFRGYWEYNLGSSYEETHMSQKAELNSKNLPNDMANTGGPYYSSIKHLDASSQRNVWVSKTIKGSSYDYFTEVHSLEVKDDCISHDYRYGGRVEEYKYTADEILTYEMQNEAGETWEKKYTRLEGTKILETWSLDAESSEKKYDRNTGDLISFKTSSNQGGGLAEFDFSFCAKAAATIKLGFSACFSLTLNADLNIQTGAGIGLNLDLRLGGTFALKPSGGLKFDGVGFTARKRALLDAQKAALEARQAEARISQMLVDIRNNNAEIKKCMASVKKTEVHIHSSLTVVFF